MNKYAFRRAVAAVIASVVVIGSGIAIVIHNTPEVESFDANDPQTLVCPDPETLTVTKHATNEINPICPFCGQIIDGDYNFLTWSEIQTLASLVDLEVGIENYDCKKAVASIVFNRMNYYNLELDDVIFADNQFSVADKVREHKPSEESINAVKDVITGGITVPEYVMFFRAGGYHCWGDQKPYMQIGNTYFSYSDTIKNELM